MICPVFVNVFCRLVGNCFHAMVKWKIFMNKKSNSWISDDYYYGAHRDPFLLLKTLLLKLCTNQWTDELNTTDWVREFDVSFRSELSASAFWFRHTGVECAISTFSTSNLSTSRLVRSGGDFTSMEHYDFPLRIYWNAFEITFNMKSTIKQRITLATNIVSLVYA